MKLGHRILWLHYDFHVLGQHGVLRAKLSGGGGEDLSHYSSKIESVGLRKCPYYHYLTKKVTPQ